MIWSSRATLAGQDGVDHAVAVNTDLAQSALPIQVASISWCDEKGVHGTGDVDLQRVDCGASGLSSRN